MAKPFMKVVRELTSDELIPMLRADLNIALRHIDEGSKQGMDMGGFKNYVNEMEIRLEHCLKEINERNRVTE